MLWTNAHELPQGLCPTSSCSAGTLKTATEPPKQETWNNPVLPTALMSLESEITHTHESNHECLSPGAFSSTASQNSSWFWTPRPIHFKGSPWKCLLNSQSNLLPESVVRWGFTESRHYGNGCFASNPKPWASQSSTFDFFPVGQGHTWCETLWPRETASSVGSPSNKAK